VYGLSGLEQSDEPRTGRAVFEFEATVTGVGQLGAQPAGPSSVSEKPIPVEPTVESMKYTLIP